MYTMYIRIRKSKRACYVGHILRRGLPLLRIIVINKYCPSLYPDVPQLPFNDDSHSFERDG